MYLFYFENHAASSRIATLTSYFNGLPMLWIIALLTIGLAYVLGSLPFAVIVSRLMGLRDPRTFGSQNPGATNVLRSGNKAAAACTLLGDLLKGTIAVWIASYMSQYFSLSSVVVAASAIAVFLGHVFPFTLGFKGGKGVATAIGILIALQPLLALGCALTWLGVAYLSRYSSLAAVIAATLAPVYYFLGVGLMWPLNKPIAIAIFTLSVLLLWRHAGNIRRLLLGTESRIGQKKT